MLKKFSPCERTISLSARKSESGRCRTENELMSTGGA